MKPLDNGRWTYVKFFAAMLIFGTNGLLVAHIPLASSQLVLCRTALGSLFMLLVLLAGRSFSPRRLLAHPLPLLLGGICLGVSWVFLFEAYRYATVSLGTMVYYCGPILVMALSPLLLKERLSWNKLLAIVAVLCGMALITGLSRPEGNIRYGLLCGGAAALGYAGLIITNKFIRAVNSVEATFSQLLVAFVILLIYNLCLAPAPWPRLSGGSLAALLTLCLVNTGLACYLYFSAIRRLPAQTVALCSYLDPLSALIFSALWLGERLTLPQLLGCALILGGALLGEVKLNNNKQEAVS